MVSFLDFSVIIVPLLGISSIFYASYIRPLVLIHGKGRTVTPLNDGKCTQVRGLEGCEDMYLDRTSGLLYLACLAPSLRQHWEPCLQQLNATALPAVAPGYIATYDTRTGDQKTLAMEGLEGGLLPHGFDIFVDEPSEEGAERKATVFAINHRVPKNLLLSAASTGADSVVEVFETTIGGSTLRHVQTISSGAIVTPNSIVAISSIAFYVSNDHYRRTGLLPYCDLTNSWSSTCTIAYDETLFPNGLARGPEETIYAASSLLGSISQLAMGADGELALLKTIEVPRMLDNLHVEPDGALYVTAIPIAEQFGMALRGERACATEVYRITNETGSSAYYGGAEQVEKIFADDGSNVYATTGAIPFEGKLYLVGLPSPYMSVCEIDDLS